MLLKDYDAARRLAADRTDGWLKARRARYDRIGTWFALAGLLGFGLMFGGERFFAWSSPGFASAFPGLYRIVTILLPALCIAGFFFSGQFLERRRGVIDLARRLQQEAAEKKE
ncbi:MAG TPA: hypothetical protein VL426_03710 [Candidatus Binatia bacterium]|jgi:hypothetical protein|nr:hypothetical protein [Candidatus Binatia bacterium]